MLLLALMLHQDSSDERKKKKGNGPKQSSGAGTSQGSAPWGRWGLPSNHTSPRFGGNSEDICELREHVPSCSGRPGTLTVLLPTAKNVFQCNYRR